MRLYVVSKQPLLAREGVLRCDPKHNEEWSSLKMHNEEDPGWGLYAAVCIRQMCSSHKPSADVDLEPIYVAATGEARVVWDGSVTLPIGQTGWRETSLNARVEVTYYGAEWAWLTADERWEARQFFPRTAP